MHTARVSSVNKTTSVAGSAELHSRNNQLSHPVQTESNLIDLIRVTRDSDDRDALDNLATAVCTHPAFQGLVRRVASRRLMRLSRIADLDDAAMMLVAEFWVKDGLGYLRMLANDPEVEVVDHLRSRLDMRARRLFAVEYCAVCHRTKRGLVRHLNEVDSHDLPYLITASNVATESVEVSEQIQLLNKALHSALTPDEMEVFSCRFHQQLSERSTARELHINRHRVRQLYSSGMEKLKLALNALIS